jgi:hypothetical protein
LTGNPRPAISGQAQKGNSYGSDIIARKAVPPAVFVHHHVITRKNVDHYIPNDALLSVSTYAGY